MRQIDYRFLLSVSFSPEQLEIWRSVYTCNDRLESWTALYPSVTGALEDIRISDDIFYSHSIEGMPVSRESIGRVMSGMEPADIVEMKMAGQYDALMEAGRLSTLSSIQPDDILNLHRTLMIRHDPNGGHYRNSDDPHTGYGTASTIRKPVSTRESRYALNSLCKAYNAAMEIPGINKVLLAICASLDLFTISPFSNGNGRMYRLAIGFFLSRASINIHRYASLERQMFLNLDSHIAALERSSDGWSGDFFGYSHFIDDVLLNLQRCAEDLNRSFPHPKLGKVSKSDRIRHVMASMGGVFTRSDLKRMVPDVSEITIQQAISEAVSEGMLRKIGNTKGSRYVLVEHP